MDVYLMQHGEAVPADVDPDRPLTEVGRRSCWRSGRPRRSAAECPSTGSCTAGSCEPSRPRRSSPAPWAADVVDQVDGLNPNADVQARGRALVDPLAAGSLAIVGPPAIP